MLTPEPAIIADLPSITITPRLARLLLRVILDAKRTQDEHKAAA